MKILFFLTGTIWRYTFPEGFIDAGHEVEITDTIDEDKIKIKINNFNPDFLMSIGWGREQSVENQDILRRCSKFSKVPHVYWSIEDPAFTYSFSLPLIKRIKPDFIFSISQDTVNDFKRLGLSCAYMDFGIAPKIHTPIQVDERYSSSIAIVANAYPKVLKNYPLHYRNKSIETLITPLLRNNIRVDFWGHDWDKMNSYFNYNIPKDWLHGYLEYKGANKVYCSSKVILGLQNYDNQLTQRTYEILASGGFLLTNNTKAINNMFKSKKQLITTSSQEETLNLVKYYLNNEAERVKISNCGREYISDYTYKEKAKYIIGILKYNKII